MFFYILYDTAFYLHSIILLCRISLNLINFTDNIKIATQLFYLQNKTERWFS